MSHGDFLDREHEGRPHDQAWRNRLHEIVFGASTPAGQAFDVALITVILASVGAVMLESVQGFNEHYGTELRVAEWVFTVLFTVEYVSRLLCAKSAVRYATSFFGIVDLLAVIPTYLSALVPGAQFLLVIRLLRVLRVFRVLKLVAYLGEANFLLRALRESRRKITVFLFGVLTLVVIVGTLMYLIEGAENGFTSIPRSIYWAIVTLTTVGFGNISPQTSLGQFLASILMISGFGIIAVPTGIVTSEMMNSNNEEEKDGADAKRQAHRDAARKLGDTSEDSLTENVHRTESESYAAGERSACPACDLDGHDADAIYCKRCGTRLSPSG